MTITFKIQFHGLPTTRHRSVAQAWEQAHTCSRVVIPGVTNDESFTF
jgi:hypothetical protein